MKIPSDAIISIEKFTKYLLVKRDYDDKSAFLSIAGFDLNTIDVLTNEIKRLILREEAIPDNENEYGSFYLVEGTINGPNGTALDIVTVWMQSKKDMKYRFITLKPRRGGKS